ncbi:MAG: TrkH family potassium uptake protein [Oscillospiraceae bacterium]|nr:TrkH family potassium uptake protein [Oscillospiraceae bacterium]
MKYKLVLHTVGILLLVLSGLMLLPLLVSLYYGEAVFHILLSAGISAAFGALLFSIKPKDTRLMAREGFAIVALSWIMLSAVGALPFFLSGEIPNYIDAFFETVSGFTTTGSSILNNVEALSRGSLFWRSFSHWIGGMGVLLFMMAILPMSGEYQMHIMRAELPGPTVGKLVPRVRQTAKILYIIYICMTLVQVLLLRFGGMSWYESLLHAFATAGTGGFSTRSASIGGFDSVYVEMVCSVFMLLFGINFNVYFFILVGNFRSAFKNEELLWYIGIIAASTLLIALGISNMYGGIAQGLRHSFFYVTSLISTTGFGSVDYTTWPQWCQFILILKMFSGACAGSTGGGMKVSRLVVLSKNAAAELREMAAPRHVQSVRLDGKRVSNPTIKAMHTYFTCYMFILIICGALVSIDGNSFSVSFSAALTCLSNVGPGLEAIGPCGNFNVFSDFSKLILSFAMLIGRLEIFPMLVLFSPSAWKN